jgi:hydroxyethylthiazole kinase
MLIQSTPCQATLDTIFTDLIQIRHSNPVIHNISNLVVMPIIANCLLALGASPIMAHAQQELADILQLSQALAINIGTLDKHWLASIHSAQKTALQFNVPIVFDPVGAGASAYRTETAKKILAQGVQVLRGNATEIMALNNLPIKTKGVDSLESSEHALSSAIQLAKQYQCIVVVSGQTDLVVHADHYVTLSYGTPLFTKVVGMGCSLTAIIASFLAVNAHAFSACVHAVALFALVGELVAQTATGPGSFYSQLLDKLYTLQASDLASVLQK